MIALLLFVIVAAVALRKALLFAADPVGEKDCPPVSPAGSGPARPDRPIPAPASLVWVQRGGTVNDASCLSRTAVYGVVAVREVDDVRAALQFARDNGLKVSVAGVRHSMGGQAFARNALVLDMTRLNRMSLDARSATLTVQSGATWHAIQKFLHPRFAVLAMQSTDIFTVGGSISVNAHGMDHQAGSVGGTIRSMHVMLADGSVQHLSPTENPRLFNLVVGGYGLFGVILDADLEVTDNPVYRSERRVIGYRDFPAVFDNEIRPEARYELMYGHLSTAPQSFLEEMLLYTYRRADGRGADIPPLGEVRAVKLRRLVFNLAKQGTLPMRLKWLAEKYVEPRLGSCPVSRNQALAEGEACLVSRNHPMHDSVRYLKNALEDETDILQEYFVPHAQFVAFVDGLRAALMAHRANVLNASVRVVRREDNVLTYAPTEMFAVVLYLNQTTDAAGDARMRSLTSELIDLAARMGGTFFLPYQLHYTAAQLQRSYPSVTEFFAAKRQLDPTGLLTNTFYETYAPTPSG
ncbi:MAG: FAD-binding oxidoreductase [Candidatus Rokuibacteriota bacterium]|nr:MAG: FAD-binding oxidoreductase [Candidatus Rokubacteria bacterium]